MKRHQLLLTHLGILLCSFTDENGSGIILSLFLTFWLGFIPVCVLAALFRSKKKEGESRSGADINMPGIIIGSVVV